MTPLRAAPLLALIAACATAGPASSQRPPPQADERPCARNFSVRGSVKDGLTFRTHAEGSGTDVAAAMLGAEQAIARAGYQVTSSNPRSGLISSSAHAGGVVFNTIISPAAAGNLRLEMTAHLRSGLTTAPAAVRQEFCTIVEAALAPQP